MVKEFCKVFLLCRSNGNKKNLGTFYKKSFDVEKWKIWWNWMKSCWIWWDSVEMRRWKTYAHETSNWKDKVSCHSCFSSESKTTRSLKFIFWWCFFPAFHVQFHWNAIHDFVPGTRHFLLFHMAITCDHLLLDVKPAMERAYRWNDAYGEWYIIGIIAQCKKR